MASVKGLKGLTDVASVSLKVWLYAFAGYAWLCLIMLSEDMTVLEFSSQKSNTKKT